MVEFMIDDLEFDKQHIWHPYTSMKEPLRAHLVDHAEGVTITLTDGTKLIDGMSSWWAAIHGYNHPALNKAVKDQVDKMSHVMFGGLTHKPAVTLSRLLIEMTPAPLNRVFLADSGSVSVEVAIKMAFQYWLAKGKPQKNRILTVKSGYHGDTFFAMSVCDPINGMHTLFDQILPKQYFAPAPSCRFGEQWDESDMVEIETLIQTHHESIAAVIIEPVVQGAGGMRFYSPQYLVRLRELCDIYNLLLIFDEIATGFGRSGKLFGCDHAGVSPDIMCLGKALTGGYMTLAATLTTDKAAITICEGESRVFMHGPTFMGNPLACAAACASIDLLNTCGWEEKVAAIQFGLEQGLYGCKGLNGVKDVRVLGAIGVIEMDHPVDVGNIQKICISKGVWLRPFGKLIYAMPPYIINSKQLIKLTQAMSECAKVEGV